jgi:hypothetical protein
MARRGSYDIRQGSRTTDFQAWFLVAAPFLLTRRPRKAISSDNVSFESSAEHATVCPNTSDAGSDNKALTGQFFREMEQI